MFPRLTLLSIAIFVLAFSLRIANADVAIVEGIPQISPFDELYHAKRIIYTASHFPHVLERDPDRGPAGLYCPWPPLYDFGAGTVAYLLGDRAPLDVLRHVIFLPPLLFATFAAAAAAGVARWRGMLAGGLTGTVLAISPYLVLASQIGDIDHHYLEPGLALGMLAATAACLRAEDGRQAVMAGLFLGGSILCAMFVQTALLIVCGLAFLLTFILGGDRAQQAAALGFSIASIVVALYRLTRPAGYPDSQWFLGWSHVALFTAAAVACSARWWLDHRGATRIAASAWALALGGAVALAFPATATAMLGGTRFFGGDPWLSTIQEFQPVYLESPSSLFSDFASFIAGVILVWFLLARGWRERNAGNVVVAVAAIVYLLLMISSRRFLILAVPLLSVAACLEAAAMIRTRRAWGIAAIVLILVPPAVQLVLWTREPSPPIDASLQPWIRAANWLRANGDGGRVLAPWSIGHTLDVLGGQKVILDNFGNMPDAAVFERAQEALLVTDERSLTAYCDATGTRYIVLTTPPYGLRAAAATIGIDPDRYVTLGARGSLRRVSRLAAATWWWRTYYRNGAAIPSQGMFGKPLRQFRRVYADPQAMSADIPALRGPLVEIWQRVPSS